LRSFLFDTAAWRGSRRVQNMSFAERGQYHEMLIEQWEHGSAPATPEACAAELGGDLREWQSAWPKLIDCFVAKKRDGRLINRKLAAIRRERLDFLRTQAEHGRRGGKRAQQKKKAAAATPSEPQGSLEQPSSPDLIGSDRTGSDRTGSNGWFEECQQLHGGACGGSLKHRNRMLIDATKKASA
jgi:hypothetical protein